MFFWVLLGFTGFYRVLLGFTGFYLVFIVFYRVLLANGLFRKEPWKMISLYRRRIAFVFFCFFWVDHQKTLDPSSSFSKSDQRK